MIERVDESNIAAAGMVHSASWRASHGFCSPEFVAKHTPEAQTEFLRREMAAGKELFLLSDPEPAGIVSVQGELIENLYVLPERWGRGYGSALLSFAAARCEGVPRLWVLSSNEGARRLYLRLGFRETGNRKPLSGGLEEIEMTRSRLDQIRRAEAESHTAAYESYTLYAPGSWLSKPVKALRELLPLYEKREGLRVLDLGSGVGRNAIAAARALPGAAVDCVDILPVAIEKLRENAKRLGVADAIRGFVAPVDSFAIAEESYDLILAASVLEHLDSRSACTRKLYEIQRGIRPGGAVLLVMNTGVREWDADTGEALAPQFEVNLPPEAALQTIDKTFAGWEVLHRTLVHQEYHVPRRDRTAVIASEVVTFTARRMEEHNG